MYMCKSDLNDIKSEIIKSMLILHIPDNCNNHQTINNLQLVIAKSMHSFAFKMNRIKYIQITMSAHGGTNMDGTTHGHVSL